MNQYEKRLIGQVTESRRASVGSFYTDDLTWVEHSLIHSTAPKTDYPHTPYSILSGFRSVDEVIERRKQSGITRPLFTYAGKQFGLAADMVYFTTELLDPRTGETIRDPRVLGTQSFKTDSVCTLVDADKHRYCGLHTRIIANSPNSNLNQAVYY